MLSGEKQRIERTYDFIDVCGWFAARCDLVSTACTAALLWCFAASVASEPREASVSSTCISSLSSFPGLLCRSC